MYSNQVSIPAILVALLIFSYKNDVNIFPLFSAYNNRTTIAVDTDLQEQLCKLL